MSDESYLKRLFSHPRVEKYQQRKTRRFLVLAILGLFATLLVLAWFMPRWYVLSPLLLSVFPLLGTINMSIRGMTELGDQELDERMVQIRNSVYRRAYYLGILLAGSAVFFAKFFMDLGLWSGMTYGAVSGGLVAGVPALILAWQMPDEPAEEA